jgi:FlaA1/EpsC-like NDP-sugar epimerase
VNLNFNLESFIKTSVTGRQESLLTNDFCQNREELQNRLSGKKVLVIGGAGTIGSYYIKALLHYPVSELVVADTNENGLTELVRDIRSSTEYIVPEKLTAYPVDFGSEVFGKIFRQYAPFDIVANFAAHKHVRSEKDIFSVEAMFRNNVFKAKRLLGLLAETPPRHFFCVSTDKAANPVNLMGASKKLMEELIMAYSGKLPIKTRLFNEYDWV